MKKLLVNHTVKYDKNVKSFLKKQLNKAVNKTNLFISNKINKSLSDLPDYFKPKQVMINQKVDYEIFKSNITDCFKSLGKEFKMMANNE